MSALLLGACGGGSDDEASTTTEPSIAVTLAPSTTAAATTTTAAPTTTTTIALITEGATVAVANASGINGGAGRLSDRLEVAGFTMTDPTNSADSVGQLATSQVYFVADDEEALAVAQSIRLVLGGGDIEVVEVGTPAPTSSGELGSATVVVLMGNDVVDKSLEELQGLVVATPETTTPDETATTDSASPAETTTETTAG